jgi:predicted nucleotidyltransferase component of viral defense system
MGRTQSMPQYNRNDLEIAARNQHFTRDTFEKVLRLKTILDWINTHEFLKTHLILKGGTAINLTVFDLPRLSVDIDMDFVPNLPREDMLQTRETISGIIKAYMDSEGYAFSPASRIHHSLDAFHFTYTNVAGNQDMIRKQQLIDEGISPESGIDKELSCCFEKKMSDGSPVEWLLV